MCPFLVRFVNNRSASGGNSTPIAQGEWVVPLSDLSCLNTLELLESGGALPEDGNLEPLLADGLVVRGDDGHWTLTVQGRLRLANLRSLERQRQNR